MEVWQHYLLHKGEEYAELNLVERPTRLYRWKTTCCMDEDVALGYLRNLIWRTGYLWILSLSEVTQELRGVLTTLNYYL